jgi:hypothetical protein
VDPAALLGALGSVPDSRNAKGRRYALAFILAVCVVAVLAGAENYREMAAVAASISRPMPCALGAEWNYFRMREKESALVTLGAAHANRETARFIDGNLRPGGVDRGDRSSRTRAAAPITRCATFWAFS